MTVDIYFDAHVENMKRDLQSIVKLKSILDSSTQLGTALTINTNYGYDTPIHEAAYCMSRAVRSALSEKSQSFTKLLKPRNLFTRIKSLYQLLYSDGEVEDLVFAHDYCKKCGLDAEVESLRRLDAHVKKTKGIIFSALACMSVVTLVGILVRLTS